ncbi:nucleoside deaminase [Magnetofaba australis]|uniref:Putative guanine deaminase n=1 Tax=Magnetofaba australis IT-1 TaxID=1434232 RepID=A0A1Y2K0A8_9PROT|nr:nucleoside deaminase [Magnetofaba australis]OSM00234.1 putative guanine deaminase [Magnetofaba australis IT-1]
MTLTPEQHALLSRAAQLSEEKMRAGCGGPFGALLADTQTHVIIAEGWNQVTSGNDPTAHAEISAIRAAAQALQRFDLSGLTLYTSCEPCPMCLAAAYWARVDAIIYANTRQQAAQIGFDDEWIYQEVAKPIAQRSLPMRHAPLKEAEAAFAHWREWAEKTPY